MVVEELHRLSPDEFRRLVEAGVFDEDARVELIEGLIVDMSPKSAEHEAVIAFLAELLHDGIDRRRTQLRVGAPLTIGDSEPEPDLIVIARATPGTGHPVTAALVIEVAVSSQRRDLVDKPRIYARAGIPTYLVVDVDAGVALEHREPREGGYARVRELAPDDRLPLDVVGAEPVALRAVLAQAAR